MRYIPMMGTPETTKTAGGSLNHRRFRNICIFVKAWWKARAGIPPFTGVLKLEPYLRKGALYLKIGPDIVFVHINSVVTISCRSKRRPENLEP